MSAIEYMPKQQLERTSCYYMFTIIIPANHVFLETPCFIFPIQIFQPTIPAEIINSLDNTDKTCTLGPLPTKQLNNNTEDVDVAPIITRITFHPRMQSCLCRYVTNVLNAILDNREITAHVLIDFKC